MMGNTSSLRRAFSFLLGLFLLVEGVCPKGLSAEALLKPFPVLGTVNIPEGNWREVPEMLGSWPDRVVSDAVRYQLLVSSAEQYFVQNLLDDGRKAFQRLLKSKKPEPSQFFIDMSKMRLAEIDLLDGRVEEALAQIEPLTKDQNLYLAQEAMFLQARTYLFSRRWKDLEVVTSRLLAANPSYGVDLAMNLLRGVAALEQDRYDQALDYFKRFPDEPSSMYYQAACYVQKKDLASALPIYQTILQKSPYSEWVDRMRLTLGEAFYAAKDYNTAGEFFKPVTRAGAERSLRCLALHRRACLTFEQRKFADSEKILTFLLKEFPNHPLRSQWSYLYASIPIFQKDWKKAIKEQKTALEMERGLAPKLHGVDVEQLKLSARFRIMWAHLLLNDFTGTRSLADEFIRKYPKELMTSYAYLAKGLALYRTAEYDRALETYQTLINEYPKSSACGKAIYLMTLCLHSSRDPFRMAGVLNQVYERMQKAQTKGIDEWTENTLYWVADAYYQLNDLVSAEKIYREFISRAPSSPLVPYALAALGATYSAQGPTRDNEAIIAFQQAQLRSKDLNNRELAEQVQLEMSKVFFNQRDFAKATSSWENLALTATQPEVRAESLYRAGEALYRQEFFNEAVNKWRSIARNPANKNSVWSSKALIQAGNTLSGLGKWNDAASVFKEAKQRYPDTESGKEGSFLLAQSYFNQGNLNGAVSELIAFSKQYPDDARIAKAADNLLSAYHQRKLSLPAADQAALLKLAPGSSGGAALLWEKGGNLFNQAKYVDAQKFFEKIMLSYPNDEYAPLAYFYNADCFFWQQRWEDAANAYQNFFLSFPKHERVPNARFQKAVCLFRKGAFDDCVTEFNEFLKKYPEHPLAKEAWLNIALAHKKAFKLDDAVKTYQYIIAKYPNDPKMNAVWLQMGSLLDVQGKRADAEKIYSKVPEAAPEYPESVYRRALLAEQSRNMAAMKNLLSSLRTYKQKKNEFRVAALVKLSEVLETEGAPAAKLKPLYQEIVEASTDAEMAKQAQLRIQELSAGPKE